MDVLIVDDSAPIRELIASVIRHGNTPVNRVMEASDGLEAIEVLEGQTVDLIFSDMHMPNMDGMQLLERVRSTPRWSTLPFILVTSESCEHRLREASERGASGYVIKPFSPVQIADNLAAFLN